MPGRLVARDDQKQEVVVEVGVGQRLAVLGLLVDEHAHQVGAVAALAFSRQLAAVLEDVEGDGRAERILLVLVAVRVGDQIVGVVRVGVADHLVAPVDQLVGVAGRNVEQPGQYLDREVGGDLLDEVELGGLQRLVDGLPGETAQEVLVVADEIAGTELPLDELAQRTVAGAVGFQDRPSGVHQVVVDLLEVDELGRGERLGVLVDGTYVLVPRDGPEAGAHVALLVPVHGVLAAQRVEHPPCLVAREGVEV